MNKNIIWAKHPWSNKEEFELYNIYGVYDYKDNGTSKDYDVLETRTRHNIISITNNMVLYFANGTIAKTLTYDGKNPTDGTGGIALFVPEDKEQPISEFLNKDGILKYNPNYSIDGVIQVDKGVLLDKFAQEQLKFAQFSFIDAQASGSMPHFEIYQEFRVNNGQVNSSAGSFKYVDEFDNLPKATKMHLRAIEFAQRINDPLFKIEISPRDYVLIEELYDNIVSLTNPVIYKDWDLKTQQDYNEKMYNFLNQSIAIIQSTMKVHINKINDNTDKITKNRVEIMKMKDELKNIETAINVHVDKITIIKTEGVLSAIDFLSEQFKDYKGDLIPEILATEVINKLTKYVYDNYKNIGTNEDGWQSNYKALTELELIVAVIMKELGQQASANLWMEVEEKTTWDGFPMPLQYGRYSPTQPEILNKDVQENSYKFIFNGDKIEQEDVSLTIKYSSSVNLPWGAGGTWKPHNIKLELLENNVVIATEEEFKALVGGVLFYFDVPIVNKGEKRTYQINITTDNSQDITLSKGAIDISINDEKLVGIYASIDYVKDAIQILKDELILEINKKLSIKGKGSHHQYEFKMAPNGTLGVYIYNLEGKLEAKFGFDSIGLNLFDNQIQHMADGTRITDGATLGQVQKLIEDIETGGGDVDISNKIDIIKNIKATSKEYLFEWTFPNGIASIVLSDSGEPSMKFIHGSEIRLELKASGVDIKGKKLLNVATPTGDTDGANKKYTDDKIQVGDGTDKGVLYLVED